MAGCTTPASPTASGAEQPAGGAWVYHCRSGNDVVARHLGDDTADVQYAGRAYLMRHALSADGARYAGAGLEWWSRGSNLGAPGTLFRHRADGSTGAVVEICALVGVPPRPQR